jgi:hypothetical protein
MPLLYKGGDDGKKQLLVKNVRHTLGVHLAQQLQG